MPISADAITRERLARWGDECVRSNATPLVLVAVGHEHHNGELVVCVPEDGPPRAYIARILGFVVAALLGD